MLRLPLEATGGYDFGPIVAIAIAVLVLAVLALVLVVWLIWRFGGRARWPLIMAIALFLLYVVMSFLF